MICPECKREFEPTHGNQKRCGNKCTTNYHYQKLLKEGYFKKYNRKKKINVKEKKVKFLITFLGVRLYVGESTPADNMEILKKILEDK